MKIKRILSAACAAALAVSTVSACSNSDSSDSSEGSDSSAEEAVNTAADNTPQSVDTGWEWGNVQIVGGGFVPNIIYNPTKEGLAYCRTDIGGAYRLDPETKRWKCITDFIGGDEWNLMGIESVATDPSEPDRVYLAAGTYTNADGAILLSEDCGETWEKVEVEFKMGGNEVGRGCGERLQVDPNDSSVLYFGSREDGLFRSEDYGKSWQSVESFPTRGGYSEDGFNIGITWVAFDKSSGGGGERSKTIFAGVARKDDGNVIFRSDDAGATWEEVPNPDYAKTRKNKGMKPVQGEVSSDGYLYCTFGDKAGPNNVMNGSVQKYSVADKTWKEITPDLVHTCGYSGLSVNPNDPKMVVVTTLDLWGVVDNVLTSFDGGETWTGFWDPEDSSKNGRNYELDISESKWLDWHAEAKLGWWMTGVAINPFDPDEIMYGTGATIFKTDNLTKCNTEPVHISVAAMGVEETAIFDFVAPKDCGEGTPELYSILGDLYGFRHDDVNKAPDELFEGEFPSTSLDCAALDPNIVVRATKQGEGTIYYSTDGAKSWQEVESLPEGDTSGSLEKSGGQVKLSADGKKLLWQPGNAGSSVYITEDFGKSWRRIEDLPNTCNLETDKVNPERFYAVHDGKFYMSADGGTSWSSLTDMLVTNFTYMASPENEGDLWISVGAGGVYYIDADGDAAPTRMSETIDDCAALGLGKAAEGADYMTLYMLGEANGEGRGVYMSTDKGATWKRINDDTQKWGNVNNVISGDPKTFGRVYISTNGRGIIMGNVKG